MSDEILNLRYRKLGSENVLTKILEASSTPKEIDLSHNELEDTDIFDIISTKHPHLIKLDLCSNKIISVSSLPFQPKLYYLNMSFNKMQVLPEDMFFNLSNLRILRLNDNNLEYLPKSICSLTNLESLWIQNNKIKEIPSGTKWINLKEFSVANNLIVSLPIEMVTWRECELMNFSKNKIIEIPNLKFEKDHKLSTLELQNNLIETLKDDCRWPNGLKVVNLCENKIMAVPARFCQNISRKCSVLLSGNPCLIGNGIDQDHQFPLMDINHLEKPKLLELAARMTLTEKFIPKPLTPPVEDYLSKNSGLCINCPKLMCNPTGKTIVKGSFMGHPNTLMIMPVCSKECKQQCYMKQLS